MSHVESHQHAVLQTQSGYTFSKKVILGSSCKLLVRLELVSVMRNIYKYAYQQEFLGAGRNTKADLEDAFLQTLKNLVGRKFDFKVKIADYNIEME
uniref:Uncharacterized protein n=1 Tax=Tanacetum cinerariifolium TaxID=118510 RepID=A0A6L2M4H7_TANCI|nr:hypothetical protein [Tanacetum cinerariifolium]